MTIILIGYFITLFFLNSFGSRFLLHGNFLEILWTVLPMLVLFDIAIPSLRILYYIENLQLFMYSIKTIGHQWYWSYEFINRFLNLSFDSYILSNADLQIDRYRLLDVDNRLVIPVKIPIRNVVTSVDVIHSWALPSIGVKIDAIPGRLNQVYLFAIRRGVYFGQCSEICGMNHRFIPIVLEVTDIKNFINWIKFISRVYVKWLKESKGLLNLE